MNFEVGGVSVRVVSRWRRRDELVDFLKYLMAKFPLPSGSEIELKLVKKGALSVKGFSEYCQGLAEANGKGFYRVTLAVGSEEKGKSQSALLNNLGHEYKHLLQWGVEGFDFGGAVDTERRVELDATHFGYFESNIYLGRPADPYDDFPEALERHLAA